MYNIEKDDYKYRTNPWNKPYEDRLEILKNAKKMRKKNVVFLYPVFDSSTFRYRGYNIVETLEYSFEWSGAYFEVDECKELEKSMNLLDLVVIVRCGWDFELEAFINKVKEMGIKVLYDIDDLIYSPKYMPTVIKTLGLKGAEWDSWFGFTQRYYMIAEMCDAFITTNDYLAEYLKKDFGRMCYVVRNYMNWMQEDVSKKLLEQKLCLESQEEFVIGYFSGSPTHVNDLLVVMPELEMFLNNHEDTKLCIVGYMDLPEKYFYLVERNQIEYVPFQTFIGLQEEQAKVDLNIVPLVNNEFSNCKSELKYFESAIVGTLTCATPTFAYSQAIVNGENGYLCNKGEWLPIFEKIYSEGVSNQKKQYICKKALEEYGSQSQLQHLENIFNRVWDDKEI